MTPSPPISSAPELPERWSSSAIEAGAFFGPYHLERKLGQGGMGVVFAAHDSRLNRRVALKVILSDSLDPALLLRFLREAETVARLRHAHIIRIHELAQHETHHYFTMDLIEGRTLDAWAAEQPRTPLEIAGMVERIARALHHAHENGVIHRDVKPGNIMVDTSGEPVVMDFGLARNVDSNTRVTMSGEVVGTPKYMSPEQARSENAQLGPGTDIWALGAVMFELLTGRAPFTQSDVLHLLVSIVRDEAPTLRAIKPELPRDLEVICQKCLEKEPARRYPSMRAFAEDLRAWREHEPIAATPPSGLTLIIRRVKRRPLPYLATLLALLALTTGGAFYLLRGSRASLQQLSETHHRSLSKTVSKEVQGLLNPAEDLLGELVQTAQRGLLTVDDTERLGALLAEKLRFQKHLAWISYSRKRDGQFVGVERKPDGTLVLNRSNPSVNEARPTLEQIGEKGALIALPSDPKLKGYDPRVRPFFSVAERCTALGWTEPYKFFAGENSVGKPGITATQSLRNASGEVLGVFTADFDLAHLSAALDELEKEYGCRLFLVDNNGKDVLHEEPRDAILLADCFMKLTAEPSMESDSASAQLVVDGAQVVAFMDCFKLNGNLRWNLITAFVAEK